MQLVCPMPTIHFKPVENKRKHAKGIQLVLLIVCVCWSSYSSLGNFIYVLNELEFPEQINNLTFVN